MASARPPPRCQGHHFAGSLRGATRMQQPPRRHANGLGEPVDVQEADVALAALDGAHVSPVQPGLGGQRFLGQSSSLPRGMQVPREEPDEGAAERPGHNGPGFEGAMSLGLQTMSSIISERPSVVRATRRWRRTDSRGQAL